MHGVHSKTLSRDFKLTPQASYSQKKLNRSLSIDTPPQEDQTASAVSTVRRQLKTLMSKVTEISRGKPRGSGTVSELMEACSRLEANLDSVLREHLPETTQGALQQIEETLLAQFRTGTNIPKLKAAVTDAFAQIRAYALPKSTPLSLTDSFNSAKFQQDLSDLRDANSELTSLNEDLLKELTDTTEANKQLMQMLTKLQSDKLAAHRKMMDLKGTNQQLKARVRTMGQSESIGEDFSAAFRHEEAQELGIDTESLRVATSTRMEEYESLISDLRSQLQRATHQCSQQTSDLQSLRSELFDLKERSASQQPDSAALSKELHKTRVTAESSAATIATLRAEIEELKRAESGSTLKAEVAKLQATCKQMTEEKGALATALKQSEDRATSSVAELKALLEAAQSQLAMTKITKNASAALVLNQSDLEQTVFHLQRDNSALSGELSALKKDHEELLEKLAQLQAEKTKLTTAKGNAASAPVLTLKEGKQESLQEMEKKISALEERLESLGQERDDLLSKQHSDTLSSQFHLQEEISVLRLENQELSELVKQVQARTFEVQSMEFKSLSEAKQHLIVLTQQLAGAEVANTMLKRKATIELMSEHSPKDEEPMSIVKEVGGEIVEELQDALRTKEETANQLMEELAALQARYNSMEEDYEAKMKTLTDDNNALQVSYDELEDFCKNTEMRYLAQIENYKMEIETKSALFREQITANVKKITDCKREAEELRKEIERLTDEVRTLQSANSALETRANSVEGETCKENVGAAVVRKRIVMDGDSWWLLSRDSSYLWVRASSSQTQPFSAVLVHDSKSLTLYCLSPCDPSDPSDLLSTVEKLLSPESK